MVRKRLTLYLDKKMADALLVMSREDGRNPIQETSWILRQELKRRGLLSEAENTGQVPMRVESLLQEAQNG
jgi:hypothetical protein